MKYEINVPGSDPLVVRENLHDRWVRYKNPEKAESRIRSRFRLEATRRGGYTSGRRTRGKTNHGVGDADYDTLLGRDVQISDSRDLYRNNPIAAGVIDSGCINIVGVGLKPESRIDRKILNLSDGEADKLEDKIESEFNYYASSVECDMSRTQNFWEMQYLVQSSVFQNGDVLGLFPYKKRGDFPYGTKLQIIEGDRVSNESNKRDTDRIVAGVEKSEVGEPLAYWVSNKHPGNYINRKGMTWSRKAAFAPDGRQTAILVMHKGRPGQTRGVPYLANVMNLILGAGEYLTTEQRAATIGGLATIFINKVNPSTGFGLYQPSNETGGSADDPDYKMGTGNVVTMGPEDKMTVASPGRPNPNFDGFITSVLTMVGMGIGQPVEFVTKKYNSNYTAANAAIQDAERMFMWRRQWLSNNLCQPFFVNWFYEAVANKIISAPGFFTDPRIRAAYLKTEWSGAPIGHVDPLKEAKATTERIQNRTSSETKEARKIGNDYDSLIKQRQKEEEKKRAAGLSTESSDTQKNKKDEDLDQKIDDKIDDKIDERGA